MSALSSTSLTASLGAAPYVDPAHEPVQIRTGDQAAKNAYQEGLAFEDVLVNQLAQQMAATVPGLDGSDGSDGSSPGGSGSDSGLGPFASMLPQALTSGIMSGGGTGLAMQIARDLDPSLDHPTAEAAS